MLLVPTFVEQSPIDGVGLFAESSILKGTVVWVFNPVFDRWFAENVMEKFPKVAQDYIIKHAYFDKEKGMFVLSSDNDRFINHSSTKANLQWQDGAEVAIVDIPAGAELLCDYNEFDPDYFDRVGLPELAKL